MNFQYVGIALLGFIILAGIFVPAFAETVVKVPGDDDAPQIKLLDQTIIEGTYRYTVAMKDASTITGKSITYTRYDPLFEEYETVFAPLVTSATPNIYYADIIVNYPQTTISVNANDAWANSAKTITKKYQVAPTSLNVVLGLPDKSITNGETSFLINVRNNLAFDVEAKIAVDISGISSISSYTKTLTTTISDRDDKMIKIPIAIAEQDKQQTYPIKIALKAFGLEVTYNDTITFEGKRYTQTENEVKTRFESHTFSNHIFLDSDVSRVVFILPSDATVLTPSDDDLVRETRDIKTGSWANTIILTDDDVPIDVKVFKFPGGSRSLFILDVPEIGEYETDGNARALIRYYS